MITFKEKLKKHRKERGYTQQELADLTGISKSSISMYENGNREPNFETIEMFADFFNIELSELLYVTYESRDESFEAGYENYKAHTEYDFREFYGLTEGEMDKVREYIAFLVSQRR